MLLPIIFLTLFVINTSNSQASNKVLPIDDIRARAIGLEVLLWSAVRLNVKNFDIENIRNEILGRVIQNNYDMVYNLNQEIQNNMSYEFCHDLNNVSEWIALQRDFQNISHNFNKFTNLLEKIHNKNISDVVDDVLEFSNDALDNPVFNITESLIRIMDLSELKKKHRIPFHDIIKNVCSM